MRGFVLCALCAALVGCVKPAEPPAPVAAPPIVVVPEPAPAVVLPADEHRAPMPHAVLGDPRHSRYRSSADPVLRGLARREIKAGDPVEPILNANPNYDWVRTGDYVILRYSNDAADTSLIAKNGALAYGGTTSRGEQVEFFDKLTEAEHADCWAKYAANVRFRATHTAPPPRAR